MDRLTLRLEAIPATRHDGLISVRVWTQWDGDRSSSCGLIVMREENWVAIAFRPPASEVAMAEVSVAEGTVQDLVDAILAPSTQAA